MENQQDKILLCDPQTSGGLLIAVSQEKAEQLQKSLLKEKCLTAAKIGYVTARETMEIEVFPDNL